MEMSGLETLGAHDREVDHRELEGREAVVLAHRVRELRGVDPVRGPAHDDQRLPGQQLVLVGDHVLARVAALLHLQNIEIFLKNISKLIKSYHVTCSWSCLVQRKNILSSNLTDSG